MRRLGSNFPTVKGGKLLKSHHRWGTKPYGTGERVTVEKAAESLPKALRPAVPVSRWRVLYLDEGGMQVLAEVSAPNPDAALEVAKRENPTILILRPHKISVVPAAPETARGRYVKQGSVAEFLKEREKCPICYGWHRSGVCPETRPEPPKAPKAAPKSTQGRYTPPPKPSKPTAGEVARERAAAEAVARAARQTAAETSPPPPFVTSTEVPTALVGAEVSLVEKTVHSGYPVVRVRVLSGPWAGRVVLVSKTVGERLGL